MSEYEIPSEPRKEMVSCPGGCGALLTKRYKETFGRCRACYERENMPLAVRINNAL